MHLNEELLKRRDKRLELASRRRDFEVTNVMKRRKLDEDGVWSLWKVGTRLTRDCAILISCRARRRKGMIYKPR